MDIAPVQSWGNEGGGLNSPSHSLTISGATAGNRIFAVVWSLQFRGVSSVGSGWYLEGSYSHATLNPSGAYVYSRVATGDSGDNFSITFDGNTRVAIAAAEYSGMPTTAAALYESRSIVQAAGATTFTSGTVTPTTADGAFLFFPVADNKTNWTASPNETVTNYTLRKYQPNTASGTYGAVWIFDHIITGSSAETATFSVAGAVSSTDAAVILLYVPPAAGGGVSQELTGNSSTSAVGTLGVSAEANVSVTPTGVAGSSAVGTLGVTAEINASAELSGVAATSAVGTLTAEVGGGTTVALSGVAGTATVGTLTAAGQINEFVDLLGNSATGAVGTLIVVTGLQVALSGNAATGAVGTLSVTAEINTSATLTGVGSSGAVGTLEVTVPIAVSVELTGVGSTGAIGTLTAVGAGQVWTEITPVSTIWTEIS